MLTGPRTSEEERVYQTVSENLGKATVAWNHLALAEDIKEAGLQLVDAALQGEFPIADAAAKLLRGEKTQTIEVIESFVQALTLVDCLRTGGTPQ